MSKQTVGEIVLVSGMAFRERVVGAADLNAEGVLTFDANPSADTATPLITVEAGTTIKGFAALVGGEDVTAKVDGEIRWFTIRCQSSAGFSIVHESGDVLLANAAHRVTVIGDPTPSTVGVDARPIQVFYDQATSRWLVPNWSGGAATTPYTGTTAGGSGEYTVVFAEAYANTPNVVASVIGGTSKQYAVVTARSTTGFTVTTYTHNVVNVSGTNVLGETPVATDGLTVDVLVTSND